MSWAQWGKPVEISFVLDWLNEIREHHVLLFHWSYPEILVLSLTQEASLGELELKETALPPNPTDIDKKLRSREILNNIDHIKERSSYSLDSETSRWVLLSPETVLARSEDEQDYELRAFASLTGSSIVSAMLRKKDGSLCLTFSSGHRLLFLTDAEQDPESDPAHPEPSAWDITKMGVGTASVWPDGTVTFAPFEGEDES